MKRLRHILQSRYLFKILVVVFLTSDILFTNLYNFKSKYKEDDTIFTGTIYDYNISDDILTLYIKGKEKILVRYKYKDLVISNLSFGDKILVKGRVDTQKKSSIPNTFDYKEYLYRHKIYFIVEASSIDKLKNNSNYLYTIKNIFYKKIENLKSSSYINTFLLGDNKIDDKVKNSYMVNGISHLFSISGMHINFIIGILYFYLDRITRNKVLKYVIVDIFLIFYLLLAFSSSFLRSIIMTILFSINFIFKLDIKKIDIMFLTLIVAIVINPFIIYDIGFIYSYLISFFLVMSSNKIKKKKKIMKIIYITILSFLASFPITVYNYYEVNIISIFLNIILVPFISSFIFPLTIITFIFPIFDDILYFFTNLLEEVSLFVSEIEITKIIFSKPSLLFVIIYYIVIIVVLKRSKYMYLFVIMALVHYFFPLLDSSFKLVMFDVGQGDSFLIKYPYNKGNVLIDVGYESDNYSKIEREIIPYLKSIGVRKIDFLIITHGDNDHAGGAITLIDNFKVDKVIFNRGEYSSLEKEIMKALDIKKIDYINNVSKISIKNENIYFLNDRIFDNENDNSIVNYFEYGRYKFLFMGDSSFIAEDYLLENYNLSNISFLKVGHHGSSSSSNNDFIEKIRPKIALISVGENNYYGHPHDEVLENLEDSKVYRTDIDGSVMFKIKKNKLEVKTCIP